MAIMGIIKSAKTEANLPPQGTHPAEYQLATPKTEGKNIALGFKVDGFDGLVFRTVPASLDKGSLRMDLETLHGSPYTEAEIKAGVDPDSLIGTKCRVVIIHQRGAGGRKMTAIVNAVLAASD